MLLEYCGQDVFPSAAVCFWGEDFRRLSTTGAYSGTLIPDGNEATKESTLFSHQHSLEKNPKPSTYLTGSRFKVKYNLYSSS